MSFYCVCVVCNHSKSQCITLEESFFDIQSNIQNDIHNNGIGCINVISCIHIKYSLDGLVLATIAQVCVLISFLCFFLFLSQCLLSNFLIIHIITSCGSFVRAVVMMQSSSCMRFAVFGFCLYSFDWVRICNTSSSVPLCHFRRVKVVLRCKNIVFELNFGVPESIIFIFSFIIFVLELCSISFLSSVCCVQFSIISLVNCEFEKDVVFSLIKAKW